MSEFWKYFHDRLAWPLIHHPGPLAGLVRGLSLALDSTRDDLVYFRRQWFPELCEAELVPLFGTGRGLVRHPKETAEQFRSRVVNAWRWHRLGGKTEGLPEILKFYGFDALTIESLRSFQSSRWAEFQLGLKTPVTQEEQEALLANLNTLLWLVNEYKPARSVLTRVYTDTYDYVPSVWSGGPVSEQGWSNGFWSLFSGVKWTEQEGSDAQHDVIVSFGMGRRFQSEQYITTGIGIGVENCTGSLSQYIDKAVWSRSAWSDVFMRNHGFTIGEIVSLQWCDPTTSSYPWSGSWDARPWAQINGWDRVLPPWRFRWRPWAKVHAVFSSPGDGREHGEPVQVHDSGTWGDINACYGRPQAAIYQGTRWGDAWGADPMLQKLEILERWQHKSALCTPSANPGTPQAAGLSHSAWTSEAVREQSLSNGCPAAMTLLRCMRAVHEDLGAPRLSTSIILSAHRTLPVEPGTPQAAGLSHSAWTSEAVREQSLSNGCPVAITAWQGMSAVCDGAESPHLSVDILLASQSEECISSSPQYGGMDTVQLTGLPLHEEGWLGSSAGRRWYDYTGLISIKEQSE